MNEDADLANVHQRYVNAERPDEGIPDYFKKQLDNDVQNDLLQEAVFRELWYSDNPTHSLRSLESAFTNGRQTIGSRLDEMVEQGVLKKGSINNGDYWWIAFPDSEHPLPKDVVVHPKPEQKETSVDEFFTQSHVVIGVVALLVTAIGGAMVLFGALSLDGGSALPVPAEEILSIGLLTLFTSYIFLIIAIVVWVVNKAFVSGDDDLASVLTDTQK
jgi:hypothetical protein